MYLLQGRKIPKHSLVHTQLCADTHKKHGLGVTCLTERNKSYSSALCVTQFTHDIVVLIQTGRRRGLTSFSGHCIQTGVPTVAQSC